MTHKFFKLISSIFLTLVFTFIYSSKVHSSIDENTIDKNTPSLLGLPDVVLISIFKHLDYPTLLLLNNPKDRVIDVNEIDKQAIHNAAKKYVFNKNFELEPDEHDQACEFLTRLINTKFIDKIDETNASVLNKINELSYHGDSRKKALHRYKMNKWDDELNRGYNFNYEIKSILGKDLWKRQHDVVIENPDGITTPDKIKVEKLESNFRDEIFLGILSNGSKFAYVDVEYKDKENGYHGLSDMKRKKQVPNFAYRNEGCNEWIEVAFERGHPHLYIAESTGKIFDLIMEKRKDAFPRHIEHICGTKEYYY